MLSDHIDVHALAEIWLLELDSSSSFSLSLSSLSTMSSPSFWHLYRCTRNYKLSRCTSLVSTRHWSPLTYFCFRVFTCKLVNVADIAMSRHGSSHNHFISSNARWKSGMRSKILWALSITTIEILSFICSNKWNWPLDPVKVSVLGAPNRYSGVQNTIFGTSELWNTRLKFGNLFFVSTALPNATTSMPFISNACTWLLIIATRSSTTIQTFPGLSNAGKVKHKDYPEPVGWTSIMSLPCWTALMHCTWNSFNSLTFRVVLIFSTSLLSTSEQLMCWEITLDICNASNQRSYCTRIRYLRICWWFWISYMIQRMCRGN